MAFQLQPGDPLLQMMSPQQTPSQAVTMAPSRPVTMAPQVQHPMHVMIAPISAPQMSPLEQQEGQQDTRLMADYAKDNNPWGTATNHPGFFGKLGHLGSQLIQNAQHVEGQMTPREAEENRLQKGIQGLEADRSKEGLEGAQAGAQEAETSLRNEQAQANAPVPISAEIAQGLGHPEWEGESISPALLAGLQKQAGINDTRKATTAANVEGRENVAQTGATSRENVAQTGAASRENVASTGATSRENVANTAAQSREKVAEINAAMRRSLEGMKEASGVGKGPNGATMTTRAMAEMATTVLPRMNAISGEVDRMASDLGPAVGRWNELMVNKGGVDHPEFAHLDADLDLLASAIVRTHFGARGGQEYRKELRKQFGEAQSPEDLKQRIAAAQDWIQGYADMAGPRGSAPASGSADFQYVPGKGLVKQ